MGFLFAADLCSAFEGFGGLSAQLSHLSTLLELSILESVGVALAYRRIVTTKLQERARQRSARVSDFTELLKGGDFTIKEQAKKEIALAVAKDKTDQQALRETRNRQANATNATLNRQPTRGRSRSRTPPRAFQRPQNVPQLQRNTYNFQPRGNTSTASPPTTCKEVALAN